MKKKKRQKLAKSKIKRLKAIMGRLPISQKANIVHKQKKGKGSYSRKNEKIVPNTSDD